jgi:hypothetical protein
VGFSAIPLSELRSSPITLSELNSSFPFVIIFPQTTLALQNVLHSISGDSAHKQVFDGSIEEAIRALPPFLI